MHQRARCIPVLMSLTGCFGTVEGAGGSAGSSGQHAPSGDPGSAGKGGTSLPLPMTNPIPPSPGSCRHDRAPVLHRLTAIEYDNTLRDLLGITSRPSAALPPQGVGECDNDATVLAGTTPELVDRFVDISEGVVNEAFSNASARSKIVVCDPAKLGLAVCARTILSRVAERAFRRPVSTPYNLSADLTAKLDLMALAFQSDLTRVATMLLDWEGGDRDYGPVVGPSGAGPYHAISHEDGNNTERYKPMVKFHIGKFAYLLKLLKECSEMGTSVLDRSIILFGSSMSNASGLHDNTNLPIVLAGRGGGTLRAGRSISVSGGPTLKMLNLTLIQKMGVSVTSFAGETKTIDQL